jgi:hypothetical protein
MKCFIFIAFQIKFPWHNGFTRNTFNAFSCTLGNACFNKHDEKAKFNFHKFSIFVWFIWLIPFISGVILGMAK